MADLIAKTPLDGAAPRTFGTVTMTEVDLGTLTSIAPYKGQGDAARAAFEIAQGMNWPAPLRATGQAGARAFWFGREMVMLAGPAPDPVLADHAALTDQSDAWACVQLSGADVEAVLARLVPVDVSLTAFPEGHSARTMIQHMNGSLTRIGADAFLVLVFRSMAGTLVHDLERAMASVAARG